MLEDSNDQELDPDEIPPPIKQKRGEKNIVNKSDQILPKRTRRRAAQESNDSSGDDLMSSMPASNPKTSLQTQTQKKQVVDLSLDDLDGIFLYYQLRRLII